MRIQGRREIAFPVSYMTANRAAVPKKIATSRTGNLRKNPGVKPSFFLWKRNSHYALIQDWEKIPYKTALWPIHQYFIIYQEVKQKS